MGSNAAVERVEMVVGLAEKFYQCRREARTLLGERYDAEVNRTKLVVQGKMQEMGTDNALDAALELVKEINAATVNGNLAIALVVAAMLEIVEGGQG